MRASATVASILARLRTMPASSISACLLRRVPAHDPLRLEAVEGGAEGRALAQDRDPGQARLERVEDELLEQRAVVVFGRSPFLVVIGEIERIGAGPRAAHEPVGAGTAVTIARRLLSLGHGLLVSVDQAALMHASRGPPGKVRRASRRRRANRRRDRPLQAFVVVGGPIDRGADLDELERRFGRRLQERERLGRCRRPSTSSQAAKSSGSRIAGMRSCSEPASALAAVVTMQAVSISPPLGSLQVS